MARVVITITDMPDGSVNVVATPNVTALINLKRGDAGLTSGQAYALRGLMAIRNAARMQKPAEGLIQRPSPIEVQSFTKKPRKGD